MSNNRTKLFLLFTLIFIATIGLSAATAADIDNNATDTPVIADTPTTEIVDEVQTTDVDNKAEITKNTQTDVKTDGEANFDDLKTDIDAASEVTLTKDYKHVSGDYGLISINSDKTIDGAGHTINSGDINLFTISQTSTLTLKNMIVEAEGTTGANIIIVNGNLICENVTFDMQKVTSSTHSMIYYNTNLASVTTRDCTFENFVTTKAAIEGYRYGNLTVDNCTFKNLSAKNGAIKKQNGNTEIMPITTVKNSKFLDNNADYGVIYMNNMNNVLYVENCLFENSVSTAGYGTIYNPCKNSTIINSQFINNKNTGSTADAKGIIKVNSNYAILYTSGNTMNDPEAVGAEIYVQAGKINSPKITSEDITAEANEEVNITYTITDDNGNSVLLKDVTYSLTVNGETVTADYDKGVISKTITAPAEDGTYPVTITLSDSSKIDGEATITNAEIIVGDVAPVGVVLTDETWDQFFNEDGTPIADVVESGSELQFTGKFTNRQMNINIPLTITTGETQAVFDGCIITINDDVTIKNIEATNTNVVVSTGKTLNLYNTSFADLSANKRVFEVNRNAKVNAEKSTFTNLGTWGVFYLLTTSEGNFKDCVFTNCSNTAGGAIEIRGNGVYVVDNCTFIDNSATLRGGAIYSKGNLTIRNSEFKGNKVTTDVINKNQGGAVLYVEGSLYLYDNVMTDNTGLTADIYNSYATIYTPVYITIDDVSCEEGSEVNLTATITDADGNTIDLIAEANGISGLEDTEYPTHLNLTVEDNKYNVTRNQSLKGIVNRPITPSLAQGNYTIGAEVWTDELADARIQTGTLEITEAPNVNYAKLQKMVDEATEDTITVDMDVVRGAEEVTVVLNKSITIDLNGLTWDATQGQAIEVENGATATIKNGLIINVDNTEPSTSNAYGRLARVTSGNLVFENVTITNCTAPDFGTSTRGSLVRITTGSGVTLNNCTVEDIKGRFIIDNGKGTININDTYFNNNKLGSTDSLIENGGVTTINNTQFNDNTANWGIVYGKTQKDLITIDNTIFANNQVSVGAPLVTGADAKVINSKFLNNKATNSYTAKSGAIYTDSGSLTVYNSTFIGNTNPNTGKYGTIISHSGYFPGDLNVSNSVLIPADSNVAIYNSAEDDITAVANYNYWGTNSTPANYVKSGSYYDDYDDEWDCTPVEVKYWVVMNTTITPEEFGVDEDVTIETSYNKYTDGTNFNDLEGAFPEMEITYTVSEGSTTPESATTENGVASVSYTATESFTVTATDSYTTNVINAEATPTEPVVITLNDGNWTEYFNDDGTTKRVVTPGSELRFEGEFNDRHMIITIPLNLTTAETQAVLKNSSFTVIAGDVNITNLQMKADDQEDYLIDLEESSNSRIENNILTQTNTEQKVVTHTIDVSDSDNVIIRNNTITTVGPEVAVEYDSKDQLKLVYTTAITAKNTNAIVIDNNNVTVKGNGKTATVGTVYGISVMGEFIYDEDIDLMESDYTEHDYLTDVKIINNVVSTTTGEYGYAINVGHVNGALVDNNTITGTSENYVDAIQGFNVYNTKFTNNKVNVTSDKMAYGIIVNGFMYMYTSSDWSEFELSTLIVEGNEVSNNVIDMKANDAWAIEAVIAYDNTVEYNNITIDANNGVGIGVADSEEGVVQYNIIDIKASQKSGPNMGDAVSSYTTGIKITPSVSGLSTPDSNTAVFNNITVTAANDDVPAINVSSDSNTVTDNYLVSPLGVGDSAVLDAGDDNTVENNLPEPGIIVLNDGNWTEYFNDDGTPKNIVIPGSELRFEGEFNDRYMIITIPLNLTTADTQAVLKNSQFLVIADNVNITNVEMIGEDTEDPLVLAEDTTFLTIADSKFTVTNNDDKMETRAILIDGGSDVLIFNNTITTTGPEDPIVYGADSSIRTMYTASIESTADGTLLMNNTITTKKNEQEIQGYGTIYGVYIHGKDNDERISGVVISGNDVSTEGDIYDYGIIAHFLEDSYIINNNVETTSKLYASGIHPFVIKNSLIADNNIVCKADNLTYGIVLEGAILTGSINVVNSEYNEVYNNVLDLESSLSWAIELYAGSHNNVSFNNITVKSDKGLGIGVGDLESTISYNNIEVTSENLNVNVATYDYIDPYTTGIKIANNGLQVVESNNVTFNNVTVNAPTDTTIYAVNSSTNKNTVTDNYLLTTTVFGDLAVLDTGVGGTVENNMPSTVITDETYPVFFDENCVLKTMFNNTDLIVSGDFVENTVFIFDGVNVTVTNDGTAKFYEGQVMTGNDATVIFDGLVFENSMDAFVLESEGNIINNTIININSEDPIHAIYVYEAGNTIANTIVNVIAPSADVEYNADYSTKSPAPAAIVISSDNNLIDNTTVLFDGTESTGYYPTVDGIYIVSESTPVVNNTIKDTTVAVTGSNYVYGINVGNAKDTTIENVSVSVNSAYYADAIQLFDADTITITGDVTSTADSEAYGVYSTAMGYGFSQNIDLTGLDVTVEAPKATGVLIEGASNIIIADATYDITGDKATAINAHVDWMGNIPSEIIITGLDITIDTTGDANILYFGNASDVTITENNIEATGGSAINFNVTPNAVVTDNYILVGEMLETGIFGNYAVITTEDDTIVQDNTPTSQLIDDLNDKINELEEQIENLTSAKNTTITIDPLENVRYGDEITISGLLVNEDSIAISNQEVTIVFNDEETTVTTRNGEYTFPTTATVIGENTITVTYAGSDKYRESEATYTFEVAKADTNITIKDINPVKKGETVTITGTLTDHNGNALANKVVRLLINNGRKTLKTDADGVYTFDYALTRIGENTITATFEGDDYYTGITETITVETTALTTQITINPLNTIVKGTQATFTGTLTDENGDAIANAQVKITINGSQKTVKTDENGVFTHTYTMNTVGENTITVSYAGSASYTEANAQTTVEVVKAQAIITLDDMDSVTKGETATFSGKLTDAEGNAIANAQVKITINGSPKTLRTDENGVFTHTFKMTKEGTNNITAVFNGNNDYAAANTNSTVEVVIKSE